MSLHPIAEKVCPGALDVQSKERLRLVIDTFGKKSAYAQVIDEDTCRFLAP